MDMKLFDSELKVMGVLWREGEVTAKHISDVLAKEIGWNMNTTYTLIKRCIKKGAIERREEYKASEGRGLIDRLYGGSADKLFASLLSRKKLSAEELQRLRDIVSELE